MNGNDVDYMDIFNRGATEKIYWAVSAGLCLDVERFRFNFRSDASYMDMANPDNDKSREMDDWANSRVGKETACRVVKDTLCCIRSLAPYATSGHDLRHILFKDVTEALRFAKEDRVSGYRKWFLVSALWHDVGRLLESHFDHLDIAKEKRINHAIFSYGVCKEFLENYNMPYALKKHILYAVVGHSGLNVETFIGRATQRADRLQTVGPEGFLRAVGYDIAVANMRLKTKANEAFKTTLPPLQKIQDAFHISEFFLRNMLENIGRFPQDRENHLKMISCGILYMASDDAVREQIFYPELTVYERGRAASFLSPNKPVLKASVWRNAINEVRKREQKEVQSVPPDDFELEDLLFEALSAPGNAPLREREQINFRRQIELLGSQSRARLAQGVRLACDWQKRMDEDDQAFLAEYLNETGPDSIQGLIAQNALDISGWSSSNNRAQLNSEASRRLSRAP